MNKLVTVGVTVSEWTGESLHHVCQIACMSWHSDASSMKVLTRSFSIFTRSSLTVQHMHPLLSIMICSPLSGRVSFEMTKSLSMSISPNYSATINLLTMRNGSLGSSSAAGPLWRTHKICATPRPYLVFNHCYAFAMALGQYVVQQGSFARAKESSDDL